MTQEDKDLCKTCKHYWTDFPLPLERVIPHCEILDENMDYLQIWMRKLNILV